VDFHRPTKTFNTPIGVFEGQSDVGGPLVPGSASYDAATKQYTINSAGYNVWYTRDEFRYLWKKMSGDVSLAADIAFPDPNGYGDRKAFLIIRQNLDDDSREAMVALHGAGMFHLAWRPEKGVRVRDMEYRVGGRGRPGGASPDSLVNVVAKRLGIEKHGDSFALFVSLEGEPMHQFGPPITLHLDAPFYVGIGFCSHLPDKSDTAVLFNVVLENSQATSTRAGSPVLSGAESKHMIQGMTEAERNAIEGRALLLYDGVCALCNGSVKFMMKRDRLDQFRYAPLESDLGREMLARFDIRALPDGVVLVTDALAPGERIYHRSDSISESLQRLGAPWRMVGKLLAILPRPLRDWAYGVIARYRYRLFGRYDTCPVPSPEQRSRLLGVQ
jgi:predicted DCC family thiol-disulfide oxidoreductase YuxK